MNSGANLRADNARYVGIGEILTGKHPCVFSTVVSSCVALMIYDSISKWGGMVHILISGKGHRDGEVGRFSDSAVYQLVSEARENTLPDSRIVAKIVGGAGSSSVVDNGSLLKNISSTTLIRVMELVLNEGIVMGGMHGGGEGSRKVFFDLKDGRVEVHYYGNRLII